MAKARVRYVCESCGAEALNGRGSARPAANGTPW